MASDIQVTNPLDKIDTLIGEEIRIRVCPQLWDKTRAARGAYVGWPGLSWISVMPDKGTVQRWLDTVELFFSVLGRVGTAKMQAALKKLAVDG